MGLTNGRLILMVLLQASIVGLIGFGLGVGMTALFFESTRNVTHLAGFYLPWQVVARRGAVELDRRAGQRCQRHKVLVLEPAEVFRT